MCLHEMEMVMLKQKFLQIRSEQQCQYSLNLCSLSFGNFSSHNSQTVAYPIMRNRIYTTRNSWTYIQDHTNFF